MGREGLKGGMTRLFFLSSLLVFFFFVLSVYLT